MSKSEKYVRASECEKYFYNHLDDNEIISAMNAIKEMPAADVVPVKRGYWIPSENKTFKCSECGYGFEHEGYIHFFNFCPECGVKIEGVMDKTNTTTEKPFAILNCPECGGEVDIREMDFADNDGFALALFECKKCHKCINVTTEYKNNPRTAVSLEWNKYVVSREAYKPVKSAAEEIARNGVPVKQGHWKKGKGYERPTENGFVHDDRYFCDCCGWGCCCDTKLDFRYCPNCGAKMDGGEGE